MITQPAAPAGITEQRRHHHPAIDHAVLALLRSPAHRLIDSRLCEIRYLSAAGDWVSLPVMYAQYDEMLVVLVGDADHKRWWRRLRRPGRVTIRRGPAVLSGIAHVLDPADPRYAGAVDSYARRHGLHPAAVDRVVLIAQLRPTNGPLWTSGDLRRAVPGPSGQARPDTVPGDSAMSGASHHTTGPILKESHHG